MTDYKKIKKRGYFGWGDLIVYGSVGILIAALFFIAFFCIRTSPAEGIAVERNGVVVYTYTFDKGGSIAEEFKDLIEERTDENAVQITVYTDQSKTQYNVILIDLDRRSARITDANCSFHKDCTTMKSVSADGGVIVCILHKIKVRVLEKKEDYDYPQFGIFRDVDKYNRVWISAPCLLDNKTK